MVCFQTFQKPLLDSELLTEKEVAMIFVNWKELIMCNIKLLKYATCWLIQWIAFTSSLVTMQLTPDLSSLFVYCSKVINQNAVHQFSNVACQVN